MKMAVFDVDGTLIEIDTHMLTDSVVKALHALKQKIQFWLLPVVDRIIH